MRLPVPKALERRLRPWIERGERYIREWEWTWTNATLIGLGLSFFAITVLAVIPSWMLYFADETLKWRTRGLITVRDIVVNGWLGTWTVFFVVMFYMLQKTRRRLRGEKQAERYSGGYR